jgi:hypothetical protein
MRPPFLSSSLPRFLEHHLEWRSHGRPPPEESLIPDEILQVLRGLAPELGESPEPLRDARTKLTEALSTFFAAQILYDGESAASSSGSSSSTASPSAGGPLPGGVSSAPQASLPSWAPRERSGAPGGEPVAVQ